jgi:hypothetical protein
MTVRIYPAPHKHPLDCDVHGEGEQVGFSRLFQFEGEWVASQLSVPIPCPHCKDGGALLAKLPRTTGGGE